MTTHCQQAVKLQTGIYITLLSPARLDLASKSHRDKSGRNKNLDLAEGGMPAHLPDLPAAGCRYATQTHYPVEPRLTSLGRKTILNKPRGRKQF
jgi:hypothetical protein